MAGRSGAAAIQQALIEAGESLSPLRLADSLEKAGGQADVVSALKNITELKPRITHDELECYLLYNDGDAMCTIDAGEAISGHGVSVDVLCDGRIRGISIYLE
mmetsp:Transcript_27419/g.45710  ORF Transcript_27419/g.45710 Transcript_27419/m.45710 type:complete len:103 (+) Transcript_27419:93-401(+)|eukprot:CAMPEP_0119316912 /NCGR_PEP_ID=MMETSP1333-20130426/41360_1 /TAXON_ID=418940 /ORGANISM="Scyphosphaera apsteinii, Strain RCC1455" /LENGTH=102 /DNA_ID=CAMNT_0007322691 /DNA_START=81 /DNA_END=389 /DNA_ORIENTATION=-